MCGVHGVLCNCVCVHVVCVMRCAYKWCMCGMCDVSGQCLCLRGVSVCAVLVVSVCVWTCCQWVVSLRVWMCVGSVGVFARTWAHRVRAGDSVPSALRLPPPLPSPDSVGTLHTQEVPRSVRPEGRERQRALSKHRWASALLTKDWKKTGGYRHGLLPETEWQSEPRPCRRPPGRVGGTGGPRPGEWDGPAVPPHT